MVDISRFNRPEGFLLNELTEEELSFYLKYIEDTKSTDQDITFPLPPTPDVVFYFNDVLTNGIPCEKCGRCCREIEQIAMTDSDLIQLADHLKMSEDAVIKKYKIKERVVEGSFEFYLPAPCPFVKKDNSCSIYPIRPKNCKIYPLGQYKEHMSLRCPAFCPRCDKIKHAYMAFLLSTWLSIKYPGVSRKYLESQGIDDRKMEEIYAQWLKDGFEKFR